ncbi:A/G-specific adenine glycosylase [Fundicoccus culcitae]|uniref:Adenine DNA glycosylase n=1 Tax=Fundicoccus culcitae TaxID=2969821 RepID=A0ABY5P591_9LACT|nr:A/G-specific adenine glycosylase [Fundicoccus culcitae]UUX33859.1 A/G-specific adenine glycosylase [Fundicoccus culcitae]
MKDIVRDTLNKYHWDKQKIHDFRKVLLDWYDENRRDLPWRQTKNPYFIWVSEIMLQQTQVQTVIPYYLRFIDTLPTIEALAKVDKEALYLLWQGLGYYSRVNNMQTAAQQIMANFDGQLPADYDQLLSLKGIGSYTAAAIASIAFDIPKAAVDGNLMRITARLFELDLDISQASSKKVFEGLLNTLIDPHRPGDFNQALMDLGATIMTPSNPTPELSPLKAFDASYQNGTAHLYPVKKKKVKQSHHYFLAYYVQDDSGRALMRQHSQQELLSRLWHFPMIEVSQLNEGLTKDELLQPLYEWLTTTASNILEETGHSASNTPAIKDKLEIRPTDNERYLFDQFPMVKHVFSHRVWHVQIIPVRLHQVALPLELTDQIKWVTAKDVDQLAVSSLQEKLMQHILDYMGEGEG